MSAKSPRSFIPPPDSGRYDSGTDQWGQVFKPRRRRGHNAGLLLGRPGGGTVVSRDPFKAVTFVANHDTDIIWNKYPAYAFILTYEDQPVIFYHDYEEWLNKDRLKNLIWIHDHLAGGSTGIVYYDSDELIFVRNGYGDKPGLITYINLGSSRTGRWVQISKFAGSCIHEYTGNLGGWVDRYVDSNGWVYLGAPPHDPANGQYGYSVWSYCGIG